MARRNIADLFDQRVLDYIKNNDSHPTRLEMLLIQLIVELKRQVNKQQQTIDELKILNTKL